MKIKTYCKLKYAKTIIAGSLVGATVALGGLSLINCAVTGEFKPYVSKDDKVKTHKLVSHVYYKGNEKVYKTYVINENPQKVFAYKYIDPKDGTGEYQFWDVSNLSSDEFNQAYSYLNSKNTYDLDKTQAYMLEHATRLDDNLCDYQKYFDLEDENTLIYVKNEDILNDVKFKSIVKNSKSLVTLYCIDGFVFVSMTSLGGIKGFSYANKQKKKRKYI